MHDQNAMLAAVQSIYEAFGRGDVPTILSKLSPEIVWEYGFTPNEVPWLQHRAGHAGVLAFFEALGGNVEITHFAPTDLLLGQGKVVALIELRGVVRATGVPLAESDEVHIWHFGADGKVDRFRHVLDTLQHERGWRGR
jgi:ketosteroid isomerase-like protein